VVGLESQLVLEQNDSAKLGGVVFNIEAVGLTLNNGVAPTHTDVVNSHLTFVAATKLELALLRSNSEQMDIPGRILVERHGLEEDVVGIGLSSDFLGQIDNLVDHVCNLEGVWVHGLANLALESLPIEGPDVGVLLSGLLLLLLSKHPGLEALEVDETD